MKTLKHGFQMEDPNYFGFQNYQPVTTKEILYSVIKATAEGKKKKNPRSWARTTNINVQCVH